MTYKIADGYNNTGSLADFETTIGRPPRIEQLRPGRRRIDHEGVTKEDGFPSTELEYSYLSASEFSSLLTVFGLDYSGNTANKVTIALPDNTSRTFANYNGIISLPEQLRFERGKYLGVRFPVRRLEAL